MDVFSNPLLLIVYGLAVNQAVEIWHHSTLFAYPRMMIQTYATFDEVTGIRRKGLELLLCPWCLSVWVAAAVATLAAFWLTQPVVYILAISRVANALAFAEKRTRGE